jgi:uncharacterized iron-regulated membrane protein
MTVKKAIRIIHLWLGLSSGLVVLFLGITGCMLAFQREIETLTVPAQYVEPQSAAYLPPSVLYRIATAELPGKSAHSVTYGARDKAAVVSFYHDEPQYYFLVYLNPYTGNVLRVKDMSRDFFRIIVDGHFYLWLPATIGKPIVASATLIFVVMMITGIVLWWPKNKAARKQRFSVKWNAKWRRVNYDMHNVLGFYISWAAIFIAITGLVWGFQWVSDSVYWVASGGKQQVAFYEAKSGKKPAGPEAVIPATDRAYQKAVALYPGAETIDVHFPEGDSAAIEIAANPDASTYWKTDYRYFDQYTMQEVPVTHIYGQLKNNTTADKIARMNYDMHVGAVLGLPGKIMAFFASLLAASLPVTGFLVWRGRNKKVKAKPRLAMA